MAPRILACISGWNDADLLRGCLTSVAEQGWPALYVDGAYRTYCRNRPHWTEDAEIACACVHFPGECLTVIRADRGVPYASEAAKKTAMMRHAEAIAIDAGQAEWLLILDTDERIEAPRGALTAWLGEHAADSAAWGYLNIYRTDRPGSRKGYRVPRLLRAVRGLEFRPPRDFDVYHEGERIALLEGESLPLKWEGRVVDVPASVARIRHERHLRPAERLAMSGSYIRVREGRGLEGDTRW